MTQKLSIQQTLTIEHDRKIWQQQMLTLPPKNTLVREIRRTPDIIKVSRFQFWSSSLVNVHLVVIRSYSFVILIRSCKYSSRDWLQVQVLLFGLYLLTMNRESPAVNQMLMKPSFRSVTGIKGSKISRPEIKTKTYLTLV